MMRVLLFGWLMLAAGVPALAQAQPQGGALQPPALGLAGIGAVLNEQGGSPIITEVVPNSPAANAGLKPSDVIVWVDYRDVAGMKLEDVVSLIRGETGSTVAVTVMHSGATKPQTYTMRRAPIVLGP